MLNPVRTQSRLHAALHLSLAAALLLVMATLIVSRPGAVIAQSATPVASVACTASVLVVAPAVPEELDAGTPSATPVATYGVDNATGDAINNLIDSLAACLTAGDAQTVTTLVTDRYLADAYGGGERMTREDYIALAPSAPVIPVTVVTVGQIGLTGRDTAVAQVTTIQGNQLRTEEWTFLFRPNRSTSATPVAAGEGHWLVHQVALLAPSIPVDATKAKAEQKGDAITITPDTLKGPNIVFDVQNTDADTHEFLVLRMTNGATIDELIRPTSDVFPVDIEFIGQETIPAGETRTLVFTDMAPGEYTVVCLLPDSDGVPHLALGETTTFTVS